MTFAKFNLEDPTAFDNFLFDQNDFKATWEHYYHTYNTALSKVIKTGLDRSYAFNPAAHAFTHLVRHTIELSLKKNLADRGILVPAVHEIQDLLDAFGDLSEVPASYSEAIAYFLNDNDGSCWRYVGDNFGNTFFNNGTRLELDPIIIKINEAQPTPNFKFYKASDAFSNTNKVNWKLTMHLGEADNNWHIKGKYDALTDLMIEMVDTGKAELKEIYLPLLFNIRHAIELALKLNVQTIQPLSEEISQKNINREHSLRKLYNVFKGYLDTIDESKFPADVLAEYKNYRAQYEELNELLDLLDKKSRSFRYPFDKTGNPLQMDLDQDQIRNIIKLYTLTDPFLTFTIEVLKSNNILFDPADEA